MSDHCWSCGHPDAGSPFCRYCNNIQAPKPDYFAFFGVERRLGLNSSELQKRFYQLSRLFHPDRYQRSPVKARQYSLEATAILNDAYRTLRDPVSRAEYFLKQEGLNTAAQSKNVPPELLEEVFDLNMALEEVRSGDESARPQMEAARTRFLALRDEADAQLQQLFTRFDQSRAREVLDEIREALVRRRYIENLVSQVENEVTV